MSLFFEKYKKMRKDQKIDLADIENRTKINVKYLEAIESGDFELIQQPYLRLFIRAYINEIGADPDAAIDELTEYLLKKDDVKKSGITKVESKIEEKEETIVRKKNFGEQKEPAIPINKASDKSKKQFNISPNLIKGILFIIVWILIIIIIRNITIESETGNPGTQQDQKVNIISNYVDFEQLQSDYIEKSTQQNALELTAPFIVKIVTRNTLGIVVQQDDLNIESIPMAAGSQNTLYYNSKLDIVLKHSNGVSVLVNGEAIKDINPQENPIRITFTVDPNTVTIKHYSPVE